MITEANSTYQAIDACAAASTAQPAHVTVQHPVNADASNCPACV